MAFFRKIFLKDMRRKIIYHDPVVSDMFQTSPNDFRKSFLTIICMGTLWTPLSDIVVILKKWAQPSALCAGGRGLFDFHVYVFLPDVRCFGIEALKLRFLF